MENKEIMYVGETTLSHFHEKNKETYSPIEHTHSWDELTDKPFTTIKGNPTALIDSETKSFVDASFLGEGLVCFNIKEFVFKEKHYYDVIINGASYSCISSSSNENGVIILGNHILMGENAVDTEEPFCAISQESTLGTICMFFYEGEQGDYTISIIEYPPIERFDGVMEYENLLNTPELVQADLSENDITKQSYVLNRTHWTENVENVLLPETTVQKMGEGNYYFIIEGVIVDIQIGEEYVVVWNGIDYVCTAKGYLEKGGSTTPYIGDMSKLDEECESTGEPFVVLFYSEGTIGNLNDNSIEATFEIKQIINVTHQLDEKYIPSTIARTEDVDAALLLKADADHNHDDVYETKEDAEAKLAESKAYTEEQISSHEHSWNDLNDRPFYTGDPVETPIVEETTFELVDGMGQLTATQLLKVGQEYIVNLDDTVYNYVAKALGGFVYIGNLGLIGQGEDTGEPFLIVPTDLYFSIIVNSDVVEHTISVICM